jgi:hypothetical protein
MRTKPAEANLRVNRSSQLDAGTHTDKSAEDWSGSRRGHCKTAGQSLCRWSRSCLEMILPTLFPHFVREAGAFQRV